jgi:acetyl/propionyl-CoA carboxylase alpha subunit
MPSTGTLSHYRIPAGPGVRVDSGVVIYSEIPIFYDPMFAKLIVWGADRTEAIRRMNRALEEFRISGVRTTVGFHRAVMNNQAFIGGRLSTRFIEEEYPDSRFTILNDDQARQAAIAIAVDKFIKERRITVQPAPRTRQRSNWKQHHRRERLRSFEGKK